MRKVSLEERFWAKVDKNGPTQPHMDTNCWVWTGSRNHRGYGKIGAPPDGVKRAPLYSHRVSYEIAFGLIPKGLSVCHHCDNPSCIRPDHLFLGTPLQNMFDMVVKGRSKNGARKEMINLHPIGSTIQLRRNFIRFLHKSWGNPFDLLTK